MLLVRVQSPPCVHWGAWWPERRGPVQLGRQMLLDCVPVVVRMCWLRVLPWYRWEQWPGLVVVLGGSVFHMMVWCGPVCCKGLSACVGRLRLGFVVLKLLGVAGGLRHQGLEVGVG